ncbi:hypothetical protein LNP18_02775 [Leuconostoc citreum]|uniref:hypothetical protein n=1 Tax=Leuconostoc citreum TaxID=33964 RepID=UPI00200B8F0B|nr:hypothetical protein [Leuconostoc citreum]MCK8605021.1 hypothetical protein [Leuconostoc citreum]
MQKRTYRMVYGFITLLALVCLIDAVATAKRNNDTIKASQTEIKQLSHQTQTNQKAAKAYEQVESSDIRNTDDFQKIGHQFIVEMFDFLKKQQINDPKSKVANDMVVSAFLGATFGGDVDEGRPVIKLLEEDMTYSKSADGTGIGFGQVSYTQSGKKQEISLLMHMQGNQITELQVGKVRDTSGSGGK